LPLSPDETKAFLITDKELIPLMDPKIRLLDDKLIHPFNELSEMYDRMRDLQWEQHD
jgi:hypothetical protein